MVHTCVWTAACDVLSKLLNKRWYLAIKGQEMAGVLFQKSHRYRKCQVRDKHCISVLYQMKAHIQC